MVSGFSGGSVKNPSYKEVCNGTTGHAEVCNVIYNPKEISFEDLCQIFFTIHDPTQLNRQGNDVGTPYRSAIYYHSDEQKTIAEKVKLELDSSKKLDAPVVTEITPFTAFYSADYGHQDYYNQNKDTNPYCSYVITPKLEKFKKTWHEKMKK